MSAIKEITENVIRPINVCLNKYLETGKVSFQDAFMLYRFDKTCGYNNWFVKKVIDMDLLQDKNVQEEISGMFLEIEKLNELFEKNKDQILKIDFLDIYIANKDNKLVKSIVSEHPDFPATQIKVIIILAESYGKVLQLILHLCETHVTQ